MIGYEFQQKRGTSAQWAAADPILHDGEFGIDKDTGIIKVGNGVSKWSQLTPIMSSQYLPILGKAADSDKLDGLDSTDFLRATGKAVDADKLDGLDSTAFTLTTDFDSRTLQASATRKLTSYWGSGTAFPVVGVLAGDTFTRTDIGSNGSTWLYAGGTRGSNGWVHKGAILCTSAARPSVVYVGLEIYESDTGRYYVYNGVTTSTGYGLLGPWLYISGGSTPVAKLAISPGWFHWNDSKGGGLENCYLTYEAGAINLRGVFGNVNAYSGTYLEVAILPVELAPLSSLVRNNFSQSYGVTRMDVTAPNSAYAATNRLLITPTGTHAAATPYAINLSWPIKNTI